MTKEEIYKKHHTYAEFDLVPNKESALEAMNEYAKQQAIAFDIWKFENGWSKGYGINLYIKASHGVRGEWKYDQISFDELYTQFIEQQNKQ